MIWDDYAWTRDERRPADGVDAFVLQAGQKLEVLNRDWQFAIRKFT